MNLLSHLGVVIGLTTTFDQQFPEMFLFIQFI